MTGGAGKIAPNTMANDPAKQPLDFKAMITGGADLWRERSQHLDVIEKESASTAGDPARLRILAKYVAQSVYKARPLGARRMRNEFGIELGPAFTPPGEWRISFPDLRVVDQDQARLKTLIEAARRLDLLAQYMILETAWWSMINVVREIHARRMERISALMPGQEVWTPRKDNLPDPSEASLRVYVYVMRNAPVAIYGAWATEGESRSEAQCLQEAALGAVAAAVRSEIRLYPELRKALSEQGSIGEVLVQELPAAVMDELANLDRLRRDIHTRAEALNKFAQEGLYKILRNKVANRLRTSRGEASRSVELHEDTARAGKTDSDLEDFEISETLRQQLQQLARLQEDSLSPQQNAIFDRLRRGVEIKEIAAELGISENQVSQRISVFLTHLHDAS